MAIKHVTVKAPGQTLAAVADWNADHTGTAPPADHGNEAHTPDFQDSATYSAHDHSVGDPTQVDHANLTNVTSDQHHPQLHNAASHTDIASTGAQIDDAVSKKHDRQHAITAALDHTSAATPAQILKADANGLPIDATNTDAEVSDAVTKKHTRSHAITSTSDHTSTATPAQMLKADANGLAIDATNTDAQVSGAVTASHAKQHAIDSAADHTSTITQNNLMDADANGLPDDSGLTVANTSDAIAKKHTQNTDTILGTDCVALDHGAAATDMVINVSYGTGDPPAANTTTEGSLFVKYTA